MYYTKAIQLEQNPIFYSNRSSCYLELDQFDRAMSDAKKTLELDPNFAKGYYKIGKVLKKQGDFEQATEMFYKAINMQPDPTTQKELEDTQLLSKYKTQLEEHISKGEFQEALRKINNILEASPHDVTLIQKKIVLLCNNGELEKAQQTLDQKKSEIAS